MFSESSLKFQLPELNPGWKNPNINVRDPNYMEIAYLQNWK